MYLPFAEASLFSDPFLSSAQEKRARPGSGKLHWYLLLFSCLDSELPLPQCSHGGVVVWFSLTDEFAE